MSSPAASPRHSSDALTAISRLLSASLTSGGPAAVHQLLVEEARGLFDATGAVLINVEPRERQAHVVCAAPPHQLPDRRLPLDALPALVELCDEGAPHVRLSVARARVLARLIGWTGPSPAALVLPLRSSAQVEHVLVLRGPHADWGQDPGTVQVASAFAAAAAAALAQLHLGAEQAMRMAQQAALARAGRQINDRGLDLPAVLHGICSEARAILDGDNAAVYRRGEDDSMTIESCIGLPPAVMGRHLPPGTGLCGRVVRADRALLTNDYQTLVSPPPDSPFLEIQSCLAVPLRWDGELRGVLSVGFSRPTFVDERDLALMEAFGELAAAACRNASTVAALAQTARTDGLTGCLNHTALRETLKLEVVRAERSGVPLSVVLLDLDEFKEVNERGGHLAGDEVLRRVGADLRATVRPYDAVARYGGDEFMIVCPGADEEEALDVAQRMIAGLSRTPGAPDADDGIAATAGVAQLVHGEDDLTLIACADRALMYGKQEDGRGVAMRASDLPLAFGWTTPDGRDGQDRRPPVAVTGEGRPARAWPSAPGHAERERLEKRTQQLTIASALGARLAGMTDPDHITEAVVDELHQAFGYFLCAAVRVREDDYVEAAAVRGEAFVRLFAEQWTQPRDAGLIGRALRARQLVMVDDVLLEPGYQATSATADVRSEMVVPVTVGDELWGVLNLEELRPRAFDENDARLLQTLADQMGSALRSATLYEQLERAYLGTAEALAAALEAKDAYTARHAHSIVDWADAVARRLEVPEDERRDLRYGAIFHDIGKISVPEAILNKRGPLDVAERSLVRRHTVVGEQILAPVEFLRGVLPIVRHEHERWDGRGYPDRLEGTQIPLAARIVFVCDAYHAMTSDRSYRAAMPPDEARAELRRCSGTQFDPQVVEAFLAVLHAEGEAVPPQSTPARGRATAQAAATR